MYLERSWCITVFLTVICGCDALLLPDFADWPVDTNEYTIDVLPAYITASFGHGTDVYLGDVSGEIFKADDSDLSKPWVSLGNPFREGPRLVFVSEAGIVFSSVDAHPLSRSEDDGRTWQVSLDVPVWRMDEDDEGNLYAGNYIKDDEHVATLYKSQDQGLSWTEVFRQDDNQHIHTVRWDDRAGRLYVAFGDSRTRGQAYSDDRGATFTTIAQGPDQGHTDVACTDDYVFWASDDQSGRVFRVDRSTGASQALMGRSQFMWFAVAGDQQIYIGTGTSRKEGGERAALLASADQGNTWQKLLESELSAGPYDQGFYAESRVLTANGSLYCSDAHVSYRIRRNDSASTQTSGIAPTSGQATAP
jgi:hypothetical protein